MRTVRVYYINFIFLATELPDPVYCPNHNCGRRYRGVNRKGSLNSHLRNECGQQKKFQCPICSKRFSQKNVFRTHCGLVHKLIVT